MVKKLILPVILLSLVISLNQRVRTWYKAKRKLKEMQNELNQLQEENQFLTQKQEYYQTEEFILREAREKLGMTHDNEIILVLPTIPNLSLLQSKGQMFESLAPWQQWWQLFIGTEFKFDNL